MIKIAGALAIAALLVPAQAHAQSLRITGACPGPIDIEVSGMVPGSRAALLYTPFGTGLSVLPDSGCAGTVMDLASLRYATTIHDGDGDGVAVVRPTLGPSACGATVQAVDLGSCGTSNTAVVGGGDLRGLLLSRWNEPEVQEYDPLTGADSVYHTVTQNDVDCNAAEGDSRAWWVDHFGDALGTFDPGTGVGEVVELAPTPYAYPKHVALYHGEVIVSSRNDCIVHRYDLSGVELGSFSAGCTSGQGVATDGENLFVSTWSGGPSVINEYNGSFALVDTHANPTGMSGNNLTDLAYHSGTGTWWGMDVSGEGGTGTHTSTLVEFDMGGAVLSTVALPYDIDGVGLSACPVD
jgi:hypothetical protein